MKAPQQTTNALESVIPLEAHLKAQYELNCRDLKYEGIDGLAKRIKAWEKDVCAWVKRLIDETIMLDGDPTYQISDLKQFGTITDLLEDALQQETGLYDFYTKKAAALRDAGDEAEGHVFQHFCKWHRGHIGDIEKELGLLARAGETGYIAIRS